jgi:putative flippase GtrA
MIGLLIAILVAALVFWVCTAIGLPYVVAVVAAILVLVAGFPTGAYRR